MAYTQIRAHYHLANIALFRHSTTTLLKKSHSHTHEAAHAHHARIAPAGTHKRATCTLAVHLCKNGVKKQKVRDIFVALGKNGYICGAIEILEADSNFSGARAASLRERGHFKGNGAIVCITFI